MSSLSQFALFGFTQQQPAEHSTETLMGYIGASMGMLLIVALLITFFGSTRQKRKQKNCDTSMLVTPDTPARSFDNNYRLTWDIDGESVKFVVHDVAEEKPIFISINLKPEGEVSLLWGNENIIWFHDSVRGLRYWVVWDGKEKWMEKLYTRGPDSPAPPKILLQLYPNLYL